MYSPAIFLFCFFSLLLLLASSYVRYIKSGHILNIADPFYLLTFLYFLYYVVGQLGRITLDNFPNNVYLYVSILVFISTCIFLLMTLLSNSRPIKTIFKDGLYSQKERKIIKLAAVISLLIGYLFWYLNYSRLGDLSTYFFESHNRIDRNARLTSMTGNLPFSHFMFIGYSFFLTYYLIGGKKIILSVGKAIFWVLPLIIFYFIEGERTALIKYFLVSFFIIIFFKYNGFLKFKVKHFYIFIFLFLSLAILGNIRSAAQEYLSTGDSSRLENRFIERGYKILIPKEFYAVNFTTNRIMNSILYEKKNLEFGYTYLQSIPYLFPRSVYKFLGINKEKTISNKLGDEVRVEIGRERKLGFGMSAMAESFANFYFLGAILLPIFLIGLISLRRLIILKNINNVFIIMLIQMLTPVFFVFHRSSFASSFSFVSNVTIISFSLYFLSFIILQIFNYNQDESI